MKIQVFTITGRKEEIFADTVSELKFEIEKNMGIPTNEQKLLSNGQLLTDENLCDTVHLLISLNCQTNSKKTVDHNKNYENIKYNRIIFSRFSVLCFFRPSLLVRQLFSGSAFCHKSESSAVIP